MYLKNLYCVTNCTNKEFNDHIFKTWGGVKRNSDKLIEAEIAQVINLKKERIRFFLYIKKVKKNDIETIKTLSHELDHLTFFVFEYYGIRVGVRDQEAFCYFQEEVLGKVLRKLNKIL